MMAALRRTSLVLALLIVIIGGIAMINLSNIGAVRAQGDAAAAAMQVADAAAGDAGIAALPEVALQTEVSGGAAVGAGGGADAGASTGVDATRAAYRIDQAWLAAMSRATGIAERALLAYTTADLIMDAEQPTCGIGWNTLAGIGSIETGHGTFGGAALDQAGYPQPSIRGPRLDGQQFDAIPDTDSGKWDGDSEWDRAVGPMQFIPSTWAVWGADGNGDGVANPNQIDDAALAAARYLCHSGSMDSPEGWRRAVFSYNHVDWYVDQVAAAANAYAEAPKGVR